MSNPLISVIVPVYNGQDYVINCIESIEKQTYAPLEIIVVNDGSTDDTKNVLEGFISVSNYDNIQLIELNDLGVSAARNVGIRAANGELISFVDADDRLMPDTISKLYDALIANEADVAGCKFTMWSDENEWKQILSNNSVVSPDPHILAKQENSEQCFTSKEYLSSQLLNGNSRCWSKLYKRSSLCASSESLHSDKVSFMEGLTIGEDMLFLCDLLPHVNKWVEIDYPGYGYFQNPKGAMYRPFTTKYLDQIRCWELVRERAMKMDSSVEAAVTRNLLMGIMLVIGKMAVLPQKERSSFKEVIANIHSKLNTEIKNKEAFKMLPFGYKLKTTLFKVCPSLYLWLYSFH